jgi:hypothetical protein
MMSLWMWFGLGCTEETKLEDWSREPTTLESQCAQESLPAMQVTCWIQLAARHGEEGDEAKGLQACAKLQGLSAHFMPTVLNTWQSECAFRLGEELATHGNLIAGLRHCAYAGDFAQNCITHSIWRNPVDLELNSDTKSSALWKSAEETLSAAMAQLQPLSPNLQRDAANQLIGQMGYRVYFGSGIAHPEPAHLQDKWGQSFRSAFAIERVRLATQKKSRWTVEEIQTLHDNIIHDWRKNKIARGISNEHAIKNGRTYQARLSPFEEKIPQQHLLGGGRRLTHSDPEIDLTISILEAFFWYPHTPPAWFATWLSHSELTIQLTAAKLFCLSNGLRSSTSTILPLEDSLSDAIRWHFDTCPLR